MSDQTTALVHAPSTGDLVALNPSWSLDVIVERRERIVEAMRKLMREGEHFGTIPGCGDRPTLLKPGAEMLCASFGLSPTFRTERRDLPGGHREIEVVCTLVSISSGVAVGQGLGSASTMESRYRWRKGERTCPACGQAAIIKGKAEYGGGWLCFAKRGGCGAKWPDGATEIESQAAGRVENPDVADTWNTVLKIAKKRALVDAVLGALAVSDLMSQDLEDIGGEHRDEEAQPRPPKPAQTRPGSGVMPTTPDPVPPDRGAKHEPDAAWIIATIAAIDEATSLEALQRSAAAINKLTVAGSPSRKTLREAYRQALERLGGAAKP